MSWYCLHQTLRKDEVLRSSFHLGLLSHFFRLVKCSEGAGEKLLIALKVGHRQRLILPNIELLTVALYLGLELLRHFDCAGRHELCFTIFDAKDGGALGGLLVGCPAEDI